MVKITQDASKYAFMPNIILTDCDGVLLNWLKTFDMWMASHGFLKERSDTYDIALQYGLPPLQADDLVRKFNESAAIGCLEPFDEAYRYLHYLHMEYGFKFLVITSMSTDPWAGLARRNNLRALFSNTIVDVIFLDHNADKTEVLRPFANTGLWWIEDKPENAVAGAQLGLNTILVKHDHNASSADELANTHGIAICHTWHEIAQTIVASLEVTHPMSLT